VKISAVPSPDVVYSQVRAHFLPMEVVFVLGGPGCGKGTQCANIVKEFGYKHLSAGDLLRAERKSGSAQAEMIESYIREGKIVPAELTVGLLKQAMGASGKRKFLVDGFPRDLANMKGWDTVIGDAADVKFVLFFDCPEDVMVERLMKRGQSSGRSDDNMETIRKRFRTFKETSMPVVQEYEKMGKVVKISAVPSKDIVYNRVRALFSEAPSRHSPFVLAGPSGVGKSTLIKLLMDRCPGSFGFSVSHTTRAPRPGEEDGVAYHFTSREAMQKDISEGKFIESNEVHGNFYGTSEAAVNLVSRQGKICILDIDIKGVESVKTSLLKPHYFWIAPPSFEVLEARLRGRGTETEEAIQRRLGNMRREMEYAAQPGNFDHIIVNDDVEKAYTELFGALCGYYPVLANFVSN